jgi:hypothetical protein
MRKFFKFHAEKKAVDPKKKFPTCLGAGMEMKKFYFFIFFILKISFLKVKNFFL